MAASVLRHYRGQANATPGAASGVCGPIPAGRALVISKITVANTSSTTAATVTIYVGSNTATDYIAVNVSVAAGQVYTETGLVALAGEYVGFTSNVASNLVVNLFGEEVDN